MYRNNNNNNNKTCVSFIEDDFRRTLMGIEQENVNLKIEAASLKAANIQQKRKISAFEGHVCKSEKQIDDLLRKLNSANERIQILEQEVGSILISIMCAYSCVCLQATLI